MTPDTPKPPALCKTCGGKREVLHIYERPGGPPGNNLLPCPDCVEQPPAPAPASAEPDCMLGEMCGMASTYHRASDGLMCCDFCGRPVAPASAETLEQQIIDLIREATLSREQACDRADQQRADECESQARQLIGDLIRRLQSTEQERFNEDHWFAEAQKQAQRAEAAEQRVADLEQNHITRDWLRADLARWKHDTVDALQAKLTEAEATIARLTKEQG